MRQKTFGVSSLHASYVSSYRIVRCFNLLPATFLQAEHYKVRDLYIVIIFILLSHPGMLGSCTKWHIGYKPFLPTDDVSL